MNALELADELERPNNWQQENNFTTRAATMLRTIPALQAEIAALKKQVDRKDNSIMALDMMIAQFEDKFGDYEKVINGVYSKVKPHEFIEAVKGKENIVGTPIMYAEWPIRNDK